MKWTRIERGIFSLSYPDDPSRIGGFWGRYKSYGQNKWTGPHSSVAKARAALRKSLVALDQAKAALQLYPASIRWDAVPRTPGTYAIQMGRGGCIKVGYSDHPHRRLKALQRMNGEAFTLLGIVSGNIEPVLHGKLADARAHGEWFHPTAHTVATLRQFGMSVVI